MKRLGLIGGIGTLAGVNLVWRMVEQCAKEGAKKDSDFPDFVYLNVPTQGTDSTGAIPDEAYASLKKALQFLNALECGVAVILCNTAHFRFSELRKSFKGTLVNVVNKATERVRKGPVAVLASHQSSHSLLYQSRLSRYGIETIAVTSSEQATIDAIIEDCIRGRHLDALSLELSKLISDFQVKGAYHIIIGCTELSMIKLPPYTPPVIDAGFVAVQEALYLCR